MAVATITIDTEGLLADRKATVHVDGIIDYVAACLALRDALHGGSAASILVRDRTAATWLTSIAASYGDSLVSLCRFTARDALAEQWNVSIPSAVSDHDILQSCLLEVRVTPREDQSFWDMLLEHFYGSLFVYRSFPLGYLSDYLNAFDEAQWNDASHRPVAKRALQDKLAQWEHRARTDAVRTLIQRLAADPGQLRRDLARYKVLRNYPAELGAKVLGDFWETCRKARVEIDDLHLLKEDVEAILPDIEYYLTDASSHVANSGDLGTLLEHMSGELDTEFDRVVTIVQAHPAWLAPDLLQQIEQRFRPIREGIEPLLAQIRRLIPPAYPAEPDASWTLEAWLEWVRDSYMPYYVWLDAQRQYDPTLAGYASMFAHWYYERFIQLKNGKPEYFAFNALYREHERITAGGAVTLVLVVDNLNFAYFDDLRRLFNQRSFSLQESRPVLSLIPTATEISKACVIAGIGDQVDLPATNYSSLVAKAWSQGFQGKSATYLATIGDLQGLHKLAHDVYFLNYIPIDKALHQDDRETGQPHADTIHACLRSITEAVEAFAKRFQIEDRLVVYVISDHGSTRIGNDVVTVLDKGFFKGISVDEHHRYIELTDEKLATLPQVATEQCYVIERHKFKTNTNYLVARQYYRFIGTTDNFYVHGGLTPEEVVVPFARFALEPVTPLPLSVRLLASEFRYDVKSQVALEIGNPNGFPLEALSIKLLDSDGNEVLVDSIAPKQAITVEIPTKFRKVLGIGNTRTLAVRLRYESQGRICDPQDQAFEVTLKSLQEIPDDDFDF